MLSGDMELSSVLMMSVAAIGGFIGGTFLTRGFWLQVYKIHNDTIVEQYTYLLKKFGITKGNNGVWKMTNTEGVWVRKQERHSGEDGSERKG